MDALRCVAAWATLGVPLTQLGPEPHGPVTRLWCWMAGPTLQACGVLALPVLKVDTDGQLHVLNTCYGCYGRPVARML